MTTQKTGNNMNTSGELMNRENKNVKIYKTANKFSIMDVQASLNYYEINKKNEEEYKGKIIFNVTDIQKSKYLSAFVNKAKTKVLMQSIINNQFNTIFNGSFVDYGGTDNENPSKVRSRILKIKFTDKRQYFFTIEEGKGIRNETGSIQMAGSPETTVTRVVPFEEAMELAHEVYDYIRDQEMLAVINGKPMHTIYSYKKEQNKTSPHIDANRIPVDQPTSSSYVITMDPWKGKRMADLTNEELDYIIEKTKGHTVGIVVELKTHAMGEVQRRMTK